MGILCTFCALFERHFLCLGENILPDKLILGQICPQFFTFPIFAIFCTNSCRISSFQEGKKNINISKHKHETENH